MKSGTKASDRGAPSRRNGVEYYDDDLSQPIHVDPYAEDVYDLNVPYLGFAGGVILDGPDNLQSANFELWPIEQIFRLKSNLISFSVAVDAQDAALQNSLRNSLQSLVDHMRDNENSEPLIIEHPRHPSRSVTFREVKFDPSMPRSVSPMPSLMNFQSNSSHAKTKSDSRDRNRGGTHSRSHSKPHGPTKPQLTQESLWDNVNIFMRPIENWHQIDKYLVCNEARTDRSILTEPAGPHYSTAFSRHPSVLSDPMKSRLMIPPPPSESKGSSEQNSQRHCRLIAALVPLLGLESSVPERPPGIENQTQVNSQMMHSIRKAEIEEATPVAETGSFTNYACLDFNERLDIELKFAGIESTGEQVLDADCPIIQDMAEALDREERVINEANRLRKLISGLIETGKPLVEKRAKVQKGW